MKHIEEEQLVLHYYGEHPDGKDLEAHLMDCAECRAEFQAIQRVLNTLDSAPVPERGAEYGAQVWSRIESRLGSRRRMAWFGWLDTRQMMFAASIAVLVLMAFLVGRYTSPVAQPDAAQTAQTKTEVRERVLLVAVGNHLERSQMMLIELANADPGSGKLDLTWEQSAAEDLLNANRIYRQTAASAGDTSTATLLEDLERALIEIARSPSTVSRAQFDELRKSIEDRGILFKVKVFGTQVRERAASPAAEGML